MSEVSARQYLLEMVEERRNERYGSEALIADWVRLLKTNRRAGLPAIRDQLIDWVVTEQPSVWGLALAALTTDADPDSVAALEQALRVRQGGAEWRDQLIQSLLHLQHRRGLDLYRAHIIKDLERPRSATLTQLRLLIALEPDTALEWSAAALSRWLVANRETSMIIQGFLTKLGEHGPALVIALVRKTQALNAASGDLLRRLFIDELQRPWIRDKIGEANVAELRRLLVSQAG